MIEASALASEISHRRNAINADFLQAPTVKLRMEAIGSSAHERT